MNPGVSICLPNRNTRPFLPERFETIFAQTFRDWEAIIVDDGSTDGSWEFLQEICREDPRLRLQQGPGQGLYPGWNACIREARGEYLYIATSDDTMAPDCLEKLVAALEENPECDLAHCRLHVIDEEGNESPKTKWWREESMFARSSGEFIDRAHVRRAPYDGLLHLLGGTVCVSITQLLIRRSLFDKIGMFGSRWGSTGDFGWHMRAGLVSNTVHVPDTWGGWRQHSSQATGEVRFNSPEHAGNVNEMIDEAVAHCEGFLSPSIREHLTRSWLALTRDYRLFRSAMVNRRTWLGRQAGAAGKLSAGSPAARVHFRSKLLRKEPWADQAPALIRTWIEDEGSGPVLVPRKARGKSLSAAI